ncbi:MAG TPA: hypothetical protein VNL17_10010 [Verrucomicrobiae bacterium]|nr:hypothetical protein [Verrucomicrobiae bacterium]
MNTPLCKYLRTKKMFVPAHEAEALAETAEAGVEADAFYWCNCTLSELGPDDKPAHLRACTLGRPCFRE